MTALALFAASIATHLVVVRARKARGFLAYSLVHGLVFTMACLIVDTAPMATRLATGYLFFTAWVLFVLFLINLRNSLSLQLVRELAAGGRALAAAELAALLPPVGPLDARLRVLEANGLLTRDAGDRYWVKRKGALLAIVVSHLSRALGLQPRERAP